MEAAQIDDIVRRGNGLAAAMVGQWHVLHRPMGAADPLAGRTAVMRLQAHFAPGAIRPTLGHPVHVGIFDSAYTRVGDYLVGPDFTWFVISQMPLAPVACVKTTRIVSVSRAPELDARGVARYSSARRDQLKPIVSRWPASVQMHGPGLDRAGLPGDAPSNGWSVLLPSPPAPQIRNGDIMTDDLGRTAVVSAAELSEQGWRILARRAAT